MPRFTESARKSLRKVENNNLRKQKRRFQTIRESKKHLYYVIGSALEASCINKLENQTHSRLNIVFKRIGPILGNP